MLGCGTKCPRFLSLQSAPSHHCPSCISHGARLPRLPGRYKRAPVHAAGLPLSADTVFTAATLAVMPLYTLMLAQPHQRLARRLLDSPAFFAAGAAVYCLLLLSWLQCGALDAALATLRTCSPLPSVARVAAAFMRAEVTALAWLHLLLLDLFQARAVFLSGLSERVPTGHSVVLCFMFGPLGVLSHMLTRGASRAWQRRRGAEPPLQPPRSAR